ncbi:hypothetical protein NA57DRAFT_61283 [Rhizodiscina lignyota]|uniref:Uncharacterized protein n=1 Tax=Rhizodiscina lignyota TaxID=1504668 RepID=A0A9P4I224_9PEZI|nr:hypothetical protein NA57DRAFT_61283 [Rhizodiscina lignyota]
MTPFRDIYGLDEELDDFPPTSHLLAPEPVYAGTQQPPPSRIFEGKPKLAKDTDVIAKEERSCRGYRVEVRRGGIVAGSDNWCTYPRQASQELGTKGRYEEGGATARDMDEVGASAADHGMNRRQHHDRSDDVSKEYGAPLERVAEARRYARDNQQVGASQSRVSSVMNSWIATRSTSCSHSSIDGIGVGH